MTQTNMFEYLYDPVKINKHVRIIELFAGYGSQALALKYLGVDYESYKICEWNYKSCNAYKRIHFGNDNTDFHTEHIYCNITVVYASGYWSFTFNWCRCCSTFK